MGAIHIGVGHDNDTLISQVVGHELFTDTAAQGLDQIVDFLVGLDLFDRRTGDVEDLTAQRQYGLVFTLAGGLRRAAGRIAFDQENFRAFGGIGCAIGEFAGQPQAFGRRLTFHFLVVAALEPYLSTFDHVIKNGVGRVRRRGKPVVEVVANGRIHQFLGLRRG